MSWYEALFLISGPEFLKDALNGAAEHSGPMTLKDQHLAVRLEASSNQAAKDSASDIAEVFCTMLSARTGEHFSALYQQLLINPGQADERLCEALVYLSWREVTYRPEWLPADILSALHDSTASDATLRKAGAYFRRGLFLSQEGWRHVHPGSFHWALAVSEAMLSYFKAVSVILGDTSKDSDYQSRYKRVGVSRELWIEVERMRERRNNYDVAHYEHELSLKVVDERERRRTLLGKLSSQPPTPRCHPGERYATHVEAYHCEDGSDGG